MSMKHFSTPGCLESLDDLSRGECESLISIGASRTEVNVDLVGNDVQEFQVHGGGNDQQRSSPP